MAIPLLTLSLRNKRDVLLARQRARQIAGLLGYSPQLRLAVAARVFEIAWQAFQLRGRRVVVFQVDANVLHVFAAELSPQQHGDVQEETRSARASRPIAASMDPRAV